MCIQERLLEKKTQTAQGIEGDKVKIGKKTYNVIYTEVFTDISKSLNYLLDDLNNMPSDQAKNIYEQKVEEIETMIIRYIRSQKTIVSNIRTAV